MHFRSNSDGLPLYHLRRIGEKATLPDAADTMDFFRPTTLIGRNVGISDYFIYSSNPNNLYISRNHARVIRSTQDNSHKLVDMSLTGVFVNDVKIDGEIVLQEGDTVTFGHPEGKIISPGTKVRQASSEYYFLFQRCCCDADGTSPLPSTVTTCTAQTQLQLPVLTSVHIPYFGHPGFFLGTNSQFPFPSGLWAAPTTTSSSSSTLSLSQSSSEFTRKNTTLSQFVPSTVTVLSAVPDNGCNSECNAAVAAKSGEETPLHSSFQKAALSKLPSESSQCHGVLEASDETAFSQGDVHKVDKGALEQVTEKSVNINSYGAAGVEVRPTSGQFHRPFLDEQNCQKASFGSSAVTKAPEGGSTFHLTLPLSEAGSPVNELESDCDELLHGVETIQIQSKDEITNESVKEDCKLLVPNSESDILLADVHMNEDNEVCPAIPLPQEVRTHAGVSVKECAIISSTNAPLTGEFKQCEVSEEYGESNTAAAQTCMFENTSTFHPLAICMEEKSYVDENTDSSQLESPEMCASNVFEPENEDQPELSESVCSENVAFSTVDKGKIPDSLSVKGSESQFSVESDLEVAGDSGLSSPEMNLTKDEQGCNDEPLILKMVRSVHVADESFTSQSSSLGKEHLESDTSPLMCKTSAHTCNSGSFVSRIDEVDNTFLIMSTSIDEKCSSDVKTQSNQLQRCAQHSNVCIQSELSLKMKDEPSLDYKMSLNAVPNVTCQADSGLSIVNISHYNVESNKDSCESCISQCKELDRALPENKCQPEMESCTEMCASNSERDIQLRIPESLSTEGGGEFTVKDKLDCIGETSLYNRPDEVEQYSVPVEDLESVQHMQSAYAESESKSLISRCSTSMLDHKSEGGLVVSNDKCDLTEKNNTLNILEENISSNVCGSMQECKLETGGISTVKLCQWRISENDSPEETCTGSSSDACISLENAEFEHINSGAVKMDLAMQPIDDGVNDTVGCLAGGRTAVLGCRIAESTESNTLLKDHFSDEKDKNSSESFDSLSEHYNCSQENSSTLVKGSSNIDSPLCVRQADTTETLPLKSAEKEVLVTEKLFSLKTSTTEEKLNVDSQSCGVEDEHLSNCAEFAKHYLDPSQDANFHQELFGSESEVRHNSQIPLQRIGFSVAQEGESPMLSAGSVLNGKTGDNVEPSINENSSVCKSPCTNEISDSSVEVMVNSGGKFRQNEVAEEESSLIRTGSSEETSSILSITTGEGKGKDEPPNDATSTVLLSDSDMADLKNSNGDENLENSPTFSALLKLNTPFSESEHVLDLPYSTDQIQSVQCHSKESECVIENEEMVQEDFGEEPHRLQNTEGKNMKLGEKQEQDNDYSFTDVLKVSRLENVPSSGDAEIEGSTSDVSISTFTHLETSTVSELLKVAVVETVNSIFEYNSCIMDRQIHGGVEKDCEGQQQAREDDFFYSNEKQKVHREFEVDELVNGVGEPVCTAANVEHSSAEVTVEEEVTRNCSFYPQIVVNKRDVSSNNVDQMDTQRVILSNSVHNGECNMLKSEVNCKETQDVNVKNREDDDFPSSSVNKTIQNVAEQDKGECPQVPEFTDVPNSAPVQISEYSMQVATDENLDQSADYVGSAQHIVNFEKVKKCTLFTEAERAEFAQDGRYDNTFISEGGLVNNAVQKLTENAGNYINNDALGLLNQETVNSMGDVKGSLQNVKENNESGVCNLKRLEHFDTTATIAKGDISQSLNSRCVAAVSEGICLDMLEKKDNGNKTFGIPCIAEVKQDVLTEMSEESVQPFAEKNDVLEVIENSVQNLNEIKFFPCTNEIEMNRSENVLKEQKERWCQPQALVKRNHLNGTDIKCIASNVDIEVDEKCDSKKICAVNDQVATHIESAADCSIQSASNENMHSTQVDNTVQVVTPENTDTIEQANVRDTVDVEVKQSHMQTYVDEGESLNIKVVCESSTDGVGSEIKKSAEERTVCNVETAQTGVLLTENAEKPNVEVKCGKADDSILTQTEAVTARVDCSTQKSAKESNGLTVTAVLDISQNLSHTVQNSALEENCAEPEMWNSALEQNCAEPEMWNSALEENCAEPERQSSFGFPCENKHPEIVGEVSAHSLVKTDNTYVAAVSECAVLNDTEKDQKDKTNIRPHLKEKECVHADEESKKSVHKESMHNCTVQTGLCTSTSKYESLNAVNEIQHFDSLVVFVEKKDGLMSECSLQKAVNENHHESGAHFELTVVKSKVKAAASEGVEVQNIQEMVKADSVSAVKIAEHGMQTGRATDTSEGEDYTGKASVTGKYMVSETMELWNVPDSTENCADAGHVYDENDATAREPVDGGNNQYMTSKLESEDKLFTVQDLAAGVHNVGVMNSMQSVCTEKHNGEVKESGENEVCGRSGGTSTEQISECQAVPMKQKLSNRRDVSPDACNIIQDSLDLGISHSSETLTTGNIKYDMEEAEQMMVHQATTDKEAESSEQLEFYFAEEFSMELSDSDIPSCQSTQNLSKTPEKKMKAGKQTDGLEFGNSVESLSSHLQQVNEPCLQNGVNILSTANTVIEKAIDSFDSLKVDTAKSVEIDEAGESGCSEGKLPSTLRKQEENVEEPSPLLSKDGESPQNENKKSSDAGNDFSFFTQDSPGDIIYEDGSVNVHNVKQMNKGSLSEELKFGTQEQISSAFHCSPLSEESVTNTEQFVCMPDEDVRESLTKGINAFDFKCNFEKLRSTSDYHRLSEIGNEMTGNKCPIVSSENVKPGLRGVTLSSEHICTSVIINDTEQNSKDAHQKEVTREGQSLKNSLALVSSPSNLGHKDMPETSNCMSSCLGSKSLNSSNDIEEEKNYSEKTEEWNKVSEICAINLVTEHCENAKNMKCEETVNNEAKFEPGSCCTSDDFISEEHTSSDAEMTPKDLSRTCDSETLAQELPSSGVASELTESGSCFEKLKRRYLDGNIVTDSSGSFDTEYCPPKKVLLLEHPERSDVTTRSEEVNTASPGNVNKPGSSTSELIGSLVRQFFKNFAADERKILGNVSVQDNTEGEIARLVQDFFRKAKTANKTDLENGTSAVLGEDESVTEEMLVDHASSETKSRDDSSSFSPPTKGICKEQCSETEGIQFVNSGSEISIVNSPKHAALACSFEEPSCEVRVLNQDCESMNIELPDRNVESNSEILDISVSNTPLPFDGDEQSTDKVTSEVLSVGKRSSTCITEPSDKTDTISNGSSSPQTDVIEPSQCFGGVDCTSSASATSFWSSQGTHDEIFFSQKSSSQISHTSEDFDSGSSHSNKDVDAYEIEIINLGTGFTSSYASSFPKKNIAESCTVDQEASSAASCLCSPRSPDIKDHSQKTSRALCTTLAEAYERGEKKESGYCLNSESDISLLAEVNECDSSKCADCVDHERCISATPVGGSQGSMENVACSEHSIQHTCISNLGTSVSYVEDYHEMGEQINSLDTCSGTDSAVSSLPEKNTESSEYSCGEHHAGHDSAASLLSSQGSQDINSSQKISQTSSTGTSECHNSGLSNSDMEGEVHKLEVQDELDTSPCINSAASSSKVHTVEMSECSDDVNQSVCDSALYLGSRQGSSDLADCSQTTSLQSTCTPNCDSLSHSVVNGEVHEIMDTCSSADDNCASGCSLLLSDNTDERSISGSQIAATSPRVIVASDRSCDTEEMGQTCSTSSSQQLPENIKDNVHSSMENAEAQVAGSCDTPRGSVLQEKPFEENDCHVKLSSSCQTVWKCSSSGEALPSEGWSEHGRESKTACTATAGAAEVLECRPSVEMEGECCLERENSIVLPLKRKRSNEECDFACTPVPPVSSVSEDEASLEITRETAEEECSNLSQSYITKNNLTESEMHYLDYKKEKTSLSSANECVNTSRSAYEVHKVIEVIVIDSSDEEETEDSEAEDGKKGRLNIKAEVDSDLDEDGSGSCREMERSAYSSSNVQGYGMSSNILELQNGRRNGDCVRDADGTRSQPVFTSSSQPGAHCSGFEKSISNLKTEAYSSTNPPHTADENSSSLLDSDSQNNSCPRNLSPVFEPQYSLQTSHSTELPSLAHQPHVIQAPQNSTQNIQELMNYKIHDKLQLPVEFDDDDDDDFNISMGDLDKVYSSDEDGTGILPDGINSSVGSVCSNQFVQHSNAEHSYATCSNGEEPVVKTKHAGSSSKSVANDGSSIAPDLPGNNRCWAVSEHDVVHQMQECNSVLKAIENSLLAVEGIDKSHMDQWRDQITELLKQTVSPKTYIAVVGDTGAGKSCLLNALLDEEALLPTSAMRACTASVVEVSCNLENQSYEADVEFLTEEEWYKELEALIKDLKDKHGNFRKRLDPKSEAGVALSRVKAVYGSIAEVEQLKQIQDVTKFLGKTHHITEKKVTEFRSKIERFIDSSADSAKGRKGGEYWPIVKRVQLRVPTADVLRSGAVLVDLPGIKDSNAARNSVAKEYLKTCSAVWVVANITRAVDDKTAKDMLNESLRTQLFMDGQYGRIAFICTKTDCFSVSEICRAVHINDRIQPLEDENAELEKRINQIKTAKEMLYSKLEEQNIKDDTGKGPDCHANELRNAILEKDIMMNSLQRKVQSNCQAVAVECVKARNKYSKKQIQMDFICGMQEIKRASNEDDDGSDEDDLMSVASEDFGLDSIFEESRKLPVFTVSSKEYLKLRGKLPREGPPQVFNSMEDTEIPALKNFTIKTAMKQSVVTAEKLIRSVTSFISHVVTYLTNQRAQDESFQARIRETVKTCLSRVKKILQEAVSECNKSVEKAFLVVISTHVSMGVKRAVAACEETAKTWASPDKPGKYPYATYRAICVRQGVYTSRAFGHIDLNEELIQPVSTTISVVWNQVFSKDLPEYLDKFKTNMLRKLKEFFREVKGKLREMNMSTTAVEYIQRQQMEAVEAELSNFIIDLKDNIMQRQRDISRILTPSVQVHMSPCFTECAKQSGAGCFQRMKTHMCNFIQTEKVTMFHSAGDKLIEQLTFLQNEICGRLTTVLEELCESLTVQFEPVLKPVKKNKGVIPDLVRICRQVREICQRSHIEFVLNDPVEEQEEEASSSTSGAVKIKVDANELNFLQGTCDIVIEDDTACLKKYKSHVQITGNGVYIKGTRQFPSLCVKFTHVAFCEFCHYMYYLRLHINPSYINVPVVRTHCDQLNMNPLKILLIMDNVNINNFCRLMEYISKKHGGPPWFQKLNMEQGVDKLRRLGVIYQCSDNKTSQKEEPTVVATAVPVFTSSSALSSHSSVPCSYQTSMPAGTILYPFGRKRGSDPLQTSALYDGKIRITSQGPHTVSQSPETNSISLVQSNPNYREMQTVIGTVSRWPDPNNIPSTSREVSRLTLWTPTLLSATTSEQIKVEEGTQRKMSHVPAATGSLYISSGSIHFEKLTAKKENEK